MFSPTDRETTLQGVVDAVGGDPRIEAAVITGSLGAGSADRWSDLDLDLVVVDGEACGGVAADWVARLYEELPVVHHYENSFETTLVRGLFLENGLLVDLAFTPSEDFSVWAPVRVAFDRTGKVTKAAASPDAWSPTPDWAGESGFAWHDVIHACVAANRGRRWQALYYLQRIRNRTLALASERHGLESDEFKHADDLPLAERDHLEASLVADLELESLMRAISIATRGFLDELRRGDIALADRLERPLSAFVASMVGAKGFEPSTS